MSNGILYSWNPTTDKRIREAWLIEPHGYLVQDNVKRVMRVFSNTSWDFFFPVRNPLYNYDDFLYAVASYPAFCNSSPEGEDMLDDYCRRELATLFAHIIEESNAQGDGDASAFQTAYQGLYYTADPTCDESLPDLYRGHCPNRELTWCDHCAFAARGDQEYYGRGALMLTGNTQYGPFSKAYYSWIWNSEEFLLEDPSEVAFIGLAAITSALFKYMTPGDRNPSVHEVAVKIFEPNKEDEKDGVTQGFGTTIRILAPTECAAYAGGPTMAAARRIANYQALREHMGLGQEGDLDCDEQKINWHPRGAAVFPRFLDINYQGFGFPECQLVDYLTEYTIYDRDDYKRCICQSWWGYGEDECR